MNTTTRICTYYYNCIWNGCGIGMDMVIYIISSLHLLIFKYNWEWSGMWNIYGTLIFFLIYKVVELFHNKMKQWNLLT